ncbi:MAG TPA: hypothetical protein VFU02_11755 [Polyangiaceae bacterium]|nr:hypothetical protein [Polyangiaceae bacterium]
MQLPVRKIPGAVLGVLALCTGCASDPPPRARPATVPCSQGYYFDGRECRLPQASPGAGGSATTEATTGAIPGGTTGIIHQTPPGPEAVRLDANAAAGAVGMLAPLVAALVPEGAAPVGPLVAGQFAAGQSLREQVTLKAGACYTVIAVAAAPITEVDLALTPAVAIPGFDPTAAKDSETGLVASIGKKPNCFKWALPTPGFMTLTLTVPAGQGVAAAQVYEKP